MSQNLEVKVYGVLEKESQEVLYKKIKSYNLGKEFNYAVVVLKLVITNSEQQKGELTVNLLPKVQYVAPFVTKKLAEEYCKEISNVNYIMMLLNVDDGKIIVKDEDVQTGINNLYEHNLNNTDISESIPTENYLSIIAASWNQYSKEQKEETCFRLGGIKNCQYIKEILDNWMF